MNLSSAKTNTPLRIQRIDGNENTIQRLREMGILLRTEVVVVRKCPFSGPLVLRVGTAFIAMRFADAEGISVEVLT